MAHSLISCHLLLFMVVLTSPWHRITPLGAAVPPQPWPTTEAVSQAAVGKKKEQEPQEPEAMASSCNNGIPATHRPSPAGGGIYICWLGRQHFWDWIAGDHPDKETPKLSSKLVTIIIRLQTRKHSWHAQLLLCLGVIKSSARRGLLYV